MDVSRVDPEEAVVDFQTLEDGDISAEIDETALADHGKEDKVLVSIRCVVIAHPILFSHSETTSTLDARIALRAPSFVYVSKQLAVSRE